MKPARSKAHLSFIRSLPCTIFGCRHRYTEAAHVGWTKGLAQKCSDFETIPLCPAHHREQHRMGLKAFTRKHSLDLSQILTQLTRKPALKLEGGHYVAYLEGEAYRAGPVRIGPAKAATLALDFFQERFLSRA